MAGAPYRAQHLSVELFRGFLEGRPEEERWELIDGVAVMMTPPTKAHQRIASNLERLLLDALEKHAPSRTVYQRVGLNLASVVDNYDPEPDVVVIDAEGGDDRYSDIFYLAAEVVSESDRTYVESKREIYKLHAHCECILTVQQDRCEVRVDQRTQNGWEDQLLKKLDDSLVLPSFGLRCKLSDLYWGTRISPR